MAHMNKADILTKVQSSGPVAIQNIDTVTVYVDNDDANAHMDSTEEFLKDLVSDGEIVKILGVSGELDKWEAA